MRVEQFQYYPQRGIVTTLKGNYQAKVNLPEAKFDTDWADSCVWLPKEGVEVLVVFINGDLNRPVITQLFPSDEEIGTPLLELAGGGTAVARKGDSVQVTINYSSTDSKGDSFSINTTANGTITSGSQKVTSG
ncbi:hypothetical protein [Desulfosporosinus sp. FKA]|uniref:hypothetical protein n=1 Tax=Desulfosporosinus sp. FKA TaxID=1969834 RepID=UPI000B4A452F|nr:hypothetical protein [Desulfosporosinus sp. FKA]